MRSKVTALYEIDKIAVPAALCAWQVSDAEIDGRIAALSLEYAAEMPAETAAAGDSVFCRGAENAPLSDRTVLLFPGRAIPGAESAETAVVGKKAGEQVAVTVAGTETTLTVEKILRHVPAPVDDALIRKLGIDGVQTLAAYRAWFREEQEQQNRSMAVQQITSHLLQTLTECSAYAVDGEEMDGWTGQRAEQMFQYMLEEGEDPRLPEEGFEILTDEQAIAQIARSLEPRFKETLICQTLCQENGIRFTAEDVREELEQYRAQGAENVDEAQILDNKYYFAAWTILENRAKAFLEGR